MIWLLTKIDHEGWMKNQQEWRRDGMRIWDGLLMSYYCIMVVNQVASLHHQLDESWINQSTTIHTTQSVGRKRQFDERPGRSASVSVCLCVSYHPATKKSCRYLLERGMRNIEEGPINSVQRRARFEYTLIASNVCVSLLTQIWMLVDPAYNICLMSN